jgi:hypothetical protein
MGKIRDWKSQPTAVYCRTSRHQVWRLHFKGTGLEAREHSGYWRSDVFDYWDPEIGETLTLPISEEENVATILPRDFMPAVRRRRLALERRRRERARF